MRLEVLGVSLTISLPLKPYVKLLQMLLIWIVGHDLILSDNYVLIAFYLWGWVAELLMRNSFCVDLFFRLTCVRNR
jgi:hypothetical protein